MNPVYRELLLWFFLALVVMSLASIVFQVKRTAAALWDISRRLRLIHQEVSNDSSKN